MKAIRQGQFRSHGEPDEIRGEGADKARDGGASDKSMAKRDADAAGKRPFAGFSAHVGLDGHIERRPDRVEAQEEAINDEGADEGGDERAGAAASHSA